MATIDRMHLGARIKHLREYRQLNESDMAFRLEMAPEVYTKTIEGVEHLPDYLLERIATELDFPADYIRDWMENPINFVQNIHDSNHFAQVYGTSTYNNYPLEKLSDLYERLLQVEQAKVIEITERAEMYERLLKAEQEKVQSLSAAAKGD